MNILNPQGGETREKHRLTPFPYSINLPEEKMKNKLFKLMTLFVVLSTLLAACGAAPASKGPAKITVFVGFGAGSDPDSMEALKKIAEE
jgi:hypothetical protein